MKEGTMNNFLLKIGDEAPNFNDILADDGNSYSLKSWHGKKLVLYFYPKDDTPGCTIEANDFKSMANDFAEYNTIVVGVSRDDFKSHCKFRDKFELSFRLLSDTESVVCNAYGVLGEKTNYGKTYIGINRTTFLIDRNGKIASIWQDVKVDGHAEAVLRAVQSL